MNKQENVSFVLHTQVVDDNGTDLEAVREMLFGSDSKYNIIFSNQVLDPRGMNFLYNCSDVQILLTNNEGWGIKFN